MPGHPSDVPEWPAPFDPRTELDWGDPVFGRRLLLEHLDQTHDGASRRQVTIDRHVRRLARILPPPPARLLDAACGPGLYSERLARLGHHVTGVDTNRAALRHARRLAIGLNARFVHGDLRTLSRRGEVYDAILLIYNVLEGFPGADQIEILRRLGAMLAPGGQVIVEMRMRPDQPPGRLCGWGVVASSLLSDRRHLLLTDTIWDERSSTYILREVAVFDDGTTATQQTTGQLCPFDRIPAIFRRSGLAVVRLCDGWTRLRAGPLSETVLVIARRQAQER